MIMLTQTTQFTQAQHIVLTPCLLRPNPKLARPRLSHFLEAGRALHPLARRQSFVTAVTTGYYHYERRTVWHTCAVAAAYAGAFGAETIQRPDFSYSMAVWRLSQLVGYNIGAVKVFGPTGRHQDVATEMTHLVDVNHWTRAGIVDWLGSINL